MAPVEIFEVVTENVFPFLRILGGNNAHAQYMKDARFTNLTPELLAKIVDFVNNVPIKDRDTNGDPN
jgi:type I restriction enzyme M protein